jgi:PhnB protein
MTPDPFDRLFIPDEPVAPRPEFAARLRRQIEVALEPDRSTAMPDAVTRTSPPPSTVTTRLEPYLIVDGAAAALDFYAAAFGAVERMRLMQPDGRVGHAEIDIDGAPVALADEFPEHGLVGPLARGGTSVSLHLVVPDVDATVAAAVEAGATLEREVGDQFHGNRNGTIIDPFGHRWTIQTPIEELSVEELQRRLTELGDDA